MSDPKRKGEKTTGRRRSEDIEEILGEVPMPSGAYKHPLVRSLFEIGPVVHDGYITWQELLAWQTVTGIELEPWEACAILDLSKAYLNQKAQSSSLGCLCPWPKGQSIWQYVCAKRYQKQREAEEALKLSKEKEPDGNRKRRRNPPQG